MLEVVGGLLVLVALFWLFVNVPDTSIKNFALVYMMMIIISGFMYAGKDAPTSGRHLQTVGFGQSTTMFLFALLAGGATAYFMINQTAFNLFPVGIAEALTSQIVLIAIFAAVSEEIFFRSSLIPTLTENFHSDIAGIGIGSVVFGLFHWGVYDTDPNLMFIAMGFSVLASVGNSVFRSTGFGYALHIVWNYLVVAGGLAVVSTGIAMIL